MITLKVQVWGLVQGVGFRYYTKRLADHWKINGTVENQPDTSVILIIQATVETAYAFVDRIRQKAPSPYARIQRLEVEIIEHAPTFSDFTIRY